MPLEIERKFLLADARWRDEVTHSRVMRQGYLSTPGGRASVRVRVHGEQAQINVKAAIKGSARAEYEYAIPAPEAVEMLETLCVGRIDKTRHYVPRDGLTWEIDEFHGDNAGLVVAEVELADVQQVLDLPAWIGREVTDDARYYNHALALHPFKDWHAP